MIKSFRRYLKVWWMMSKNNFIQVLINKFGATVFLTGKILRFVFFIAFIVFLLKGTQSLAGYNMTQIIFFFLTFNLVDVVSQFLFREVYRFRPLIVSGGFDLVLTKPISSLFRSLMGGADILDFFTIPPLIFAVVVVGGSLFPSLASVSYYILLLINGLLLATAFHILVLALGIITLEIDHTVMIYRDLTNLGRFPIDIYKEPLRGILTYFIPVGIMMTLPAKALMGLVSPQGVAVSFAIGLAGLYLANKTWGYALKKYTSASS